MKVTRVFENEEMARQKPQYVVIRRAVGGKAVSVGLGYSIPLAQSVARVNGDMASTEEEVILRIDL